MRSLWVLCLCALALSGCAPVFSDLQDAYVLEPGTGEFTPYITTSMVDEDDGLDRIIDQVGIQVAEGLGSQTELRFRIEHFMDLGSFDSAEVTAFGVGVKKGIVPGTLAVNLPIGLAVGGGIDVSQTVQTQPTVLFTQPLGSWIDFNPSAKALVYLGDSDRQTQWALNLGLGIHHGDRAVTLRPEVGWLFASDGDPGYVHFSLGITFRRPIES